jgi:hypothetical protein
MMKDAGRTLELAAQGLWRRHLAAESTEVCGLLADLGFRFHIEQANSDGE